MRTTRRSATNMESFEKLFAEAEQISDRRNKIFDKLIEKTENEIIPSFAKLLKNYDLNIAYFTIYDKPFEHETLSIDGQSDERGHKFWASDENNGTIWDCKTHIYENKYVKLSNYKLKNDNEHALDNVTFLRNSIVSIVKTINMRTEELNEKYKRKIEEAEKLL